MGQTDWIPGLFALAIGVGAGLALALRASRSARAGVKPALGSAGAGSSPEALADRSDAFIAKLRELDAEPPSAALARERYATELEAAKVLQAMDAAGPARASAVETRGTATGGAHGSAARGNGRRRVRAERITMAPERSAATATAASAKGASRWKPFLLGIWAGATVILLVFFVRDFATPREGMPGAMGGGGPAMAGPMSAGPMSGAADGQAMTESQGAGAGDSAAEPAGGAPEVSGVLTLASGVQVKPGATIFVIARPAGTLRGPPIAVARLIASSFPTPFTLGAENSMTGQPFPEKALIQVRVDFDGNPMTHDPAEPIGMIDNVARGTNSVQVELTVPSSTP